MRALSFIPKRYALPLLFAAAVFFAWIAYLTEDDPYPLTAISKTPLAQLETREELLSMLTEDPASIFTVVDKVFDDPTLSRSCHDLAHDIGHEAYKSFGFDGAMMFGKPEREGRPSVQDICAGGYVHGVLEQAAFYAPERRNDPSALCEKAPASQREDCFHGVGHALMYAYRRNAANALSACKTVAVHKERYRCFEGVWMELFWGNKYTSGRSLGWDTEKPLDTCLNAAKDVKPTCLLYAPYAYLRIHEDDYAGAIHMCLDSALDSEDRSFCIKGVGVRLASNFGARGLEGSERFALGLIPDERAIFYEGMMGYARFAGAGDAELDATCALMKSDSDICSWSVAKTAKK